LLALQRKGGKPMAMRDESLPLGQKIDQMLTEARVILPGAQALLGFQLAVALTQAFDGLPASSKAAHACALGLIALSTISLMAPAAYHRIAYGGEASKTFLQIGSCYMLAATAALAFELTADIYVVITKIADSSAAGGLAAAFSFLVLTGLWHVSPALMRRRRK